jgi:hypothetical protein
MPLRSPPPAPKKMSTMQAFVHPGLGEQVVESRRQPKVMQVPMS